MDKDLALHVVLVSIRAATSLNNLLPMIKDGSPMEEYQFFLKKIAGVCGEISLEIIDEVYERYPELKERIDRSIDKYGVAI